MELGFIGCGHMAQAIIRGLQHSATAGDFAIQATTRTPEKARALSQALSIDCHTDSRRLSATAEVVFLCTPPSQALAVLRELAKADDPNDHHRQQQHHEQPPPKLLLSVCAGITLASLHGALTADDRNPLLHATIIRAMPNANCLIQQGVTVLTQAADQNHRTMLPLAQSLFGLLGQVVELDENLMDAATALSGCGPAFGFFLIEALIAAGTQLGLSVEVAQFLVTHTLAGSAATLLRNPQLHPEALIAQIATPRGCTQAALGVLGQARVRQSLGDAARAAAQRSAELRFS